MNIDWGYAGQIVTGSIIGLVLLLVFGSLIGAILANVSRSYPAAPDLENAAVLEREREALLVADALESARKTSVGRKAESLGFLDEQPQPPWAA